MGSYHAARGWGLLVAAMLLEAAAYWWQPEAHESIWIAVGSGNQISWRSTFLYNTSFHLYYWQNFYPYGAHTYPFWKLLEILINKFNHKGTSAIRLAHPLVRIE
jgi:hypothetical protein